MKEKNDKLEHRAYTYVLEDRLTGRWYFLGDYETDAYAQRAAKMFLLSSRLMLADDEYSVIRVYDVLYDADSAKYVYHHIFN